MSDTNLTAESRAHTLQRRFEELFAGSPRIFQAPGRVNLIGEHTDYNDGFVMPAAIGFYTRVAAAPRADQKLVVQSENYAEKIELDLAGLPTAGTGPWSDYVIGVARAIELTGVRLRGASLLVDGDVPQGAGLSSSASFEVAVGFALLDLADQQIDRTKLALLCQRSENEFVGAQCGIMDQFVSSHGRRDHALMLDCRSLAYRLLPLPAGVSLVISNTMVKHSIASGEYNQRRAECEAGVQHLVKHLPHVRALRDVTLENLETYTHDMQDKVTRRCRHVITENARVIKAAAALEAGELTMFGDLMRLSHRSLRDDFAVSCSELDLMVELGEQVEGVYGTRMTGGGFGGCTISLVRADCVQAFQQTVGEGYERATGCKPEIYVCSAADRASQVF